MYQSISAVSRRRIDIGSLYPVGLSLVRRGAPERDGRPAIRTAPHARLAAGLWCARPAETRNFLYSAEQLV